MNTAVFFYNRVFYLIISITNLMIKKKGIKLIKRVIEVDSECCGIGRIDFHIKSLQNVLLTMGPSLVLLHRT
jgi:hypothetical protein